MSSAEEKWSGVVGMTLAWLFIKSLHRPCQAFQVCTRSGARAPADSLAGWQLGRGAARRLGRGEPWGFVEHRQPQALAVIQAIGPLRKPRERSSLPLSPLSHQTKKLKVPSSPILQSMPNNESHSHASTNSIANLSPRHLEPDALLRLSAAGLALAGAALAWSARHPAGPVRVDAAAWRLLRPMPLDAAAWQLAGLAVLGVLMGVVEYRKGYTARKPVDGWEE